MRKTKLTALLLSGILLLSGCDSAEQKAEISKNLKQAEKNAVAYIEEKYGFTPKICDSVIERHSGLLGSTPDSTAMIRMTYNGTEFSVYIDGEDKNTDGADNYQQDEIISALAARLSDVDENEKWLVGEIKSINVDGGRGKSFFPEIDWNSDNLYSAYFDGENFAEVFGDNICDITVNYIEGNFGFLGDEHFDFLLSNPKIRLGLISYRTEKDYQEKPDYLDFTEYLEIEEYAIQIEESLVFEKNETRHCEYTLGKYEDFYYYASENKTDMFSFSNITLPDAENWNGHGVIDGEFVTPAYRIESGAKERLYIFYPISELTENARIATYSKTAKGVDYHISPLAYEAGDYKVMYISSYEFKDGEEKAFALIKEKEKPENE